MFTLAMTGMGYCVWQIRRSQPTPMANLLSADKGYGVTTDLTRYQGDELAANLQLMYDNGFTWIRQPMPWAEIEPTQGQFNWQPYDRIFSAIEQFNQRLAPRQPPLQIIAVLNTSPAWARPANTPETTPPNNLTNFGHFAHELAQRYYEQLHYYQIWHEPNLSSNWGNTFVQPEQYTNLLREASLNIKAVDSTATIITAALAPTLENGPLNLNEMAYLDGLYRARANRWFDVVAGQIYGFATEPEQPADPQILGFNRIELLRQVMLQHDDAATPMWATAFGWAVFDDDWTGRKSLWKQAIPAVQTQRTANAVLYMRRQWPWLGPVFAIRWDTADLAKNDPAFAFALTAHPEILGAFKTASQAVHVATVGTYPADSLTGRYMRAWRFGGQPALADIPAQEPRIVKIAFEGTRFDLTVNRGPYRGYLWVTVDKDEAATDETFPANALPQNSDGQSYVVLYDPLHGSETVTLVRNLTPGFHEVEITADGGWRQWAIGGWTVYNERDLRPYQAGLYLSGLLAIITALPTFLLLFQTMLGLAKSIWAWSEVVIALYAALGETRQIIITFVLSMGLYLAPAWLAVIILPLLGTVVFLRPDLGLMLIVASLSFFQAPIDLPLKDFSPVEFTLILTLLGLLGRGLVYAGRRRYAPETWAEGLPKTLQVFETYKVLHLNSTDYAALALVILGLLATLNAQNFGVSLFEWRGVVLESVIFYFLVRQGMDFSPKASTIPWRWRLLDAWVIGAVAQSTIALYLYFFTDQSITAEGVRRALGLAYGSPNNLALFLERVWPLLLVITLLDATAPRRRQLYALSLFIVSLTIFLTFSKGTLLIALPLTVIMMTLFYIIQHGSHNLKRIVSIVAIGLVILALMLIPLNQTARFNQIFDFSQGTTSFFRMKLWQAAFAMMVDHPLLGVGLDNFLYEYRTHYLLPDAWQEPNLSHPHNIVLDFGTRLGMGGIIILLWLQISFWRRAWARYRHEPSPWLLGLMGSMVTCLGHGLVDNSYFLVDLAFIFFLTIGLVREEREENLE